MHVQAFRRPLKQWLAAGLSVLLGGTPLIPAIPAARAAEAAPQITMVQLASGQKVYVQEIHAQPIVTIDTWVNTGSAQEVAANNGVSHFLEHLLFKGTTHYKVGEIDRILESRGADFNAQTSDDYTHYHITTATPYFEEALKLHADLLLNATISTAELDRERKVVQEEINRALDSPQRRTFRKLEELLYPGHPYAMDTLGPKSNIQSLPRDAILGYYHRWYQPENFKTVIAGDVDAKHAVELVSEAFQKAYTEQARPEAATAVLKPIKPLSGSQSAVMSDPNLSAVQFGLGFQAPSIKNRDDNAALDVATLILGQGRSSRLYQVLKEQRQLANSVSAGNASHQQAGMLYVAAEVKPENRQAFKQALLSEISRFKAEGPTTEELEKAKKQVIKDFAFLTESTEGVAETLGYNITIGKLEDYTQYVETIQRVTATQVQKAVQKYLTLEKAVLVESVPQTETTTSAQLSAEVTANLAMLKDNDTAPIALKKTTSAASMASMGPASVEPGGVRRVMLPSGATLLLKPSSETQTVAIHLFARGGRLASPKPGVSELTGRLLLKGTAFRTAEALSRELETEGLSITAKSDEDSFQVTAASLSPDLPKLLLLLQDTLVNPAFPPEELDKERSDMLEDIKTSRDEPGQLMFEKLAQSLYPGHPYGDVGSRVETVLPQISRDDILAYYQQQLQPRNLVIAVVGNFDPDLVKAQFQQITAGLPQLPSKPRTKVYPEVKALAAPVETDAQKPEQAATWVSYGWLAPGISTSRDYLTLKVINALWGVGLSSRLFVELREKQGLAYHVSCMYPSRLEKGPFVMYIGTDPANLEKVRTGFDTQIKRLQTELLSPEELTTVKSKLIGTFALAHESNASQAYYLGVYEALGVGYQFDIEYPRLIEQVTAEDIQRVAGAYFSQPKVVSVVAPKVVRSDTPTPHDAH